MAEYEARFVVVIIQERHLTTPLSPFLPLQPCHKTHDSNKDILKTLPIESHDSIKACTSKSSYSDLLI